MDFDIPAEISAYLRELDAFIEREIRPLERENDNIRFFDHRREHARTDWDNDGQPRHEWEALLAEMRRRADKAGHLRFGLPKALGGKDGSNLAMAIIREHLAHKGLGLHNDLQNESSIVGNFPVALLLHRFGTKEQKERYLEGMLTGKERIAFGLTEPNHGSDATFMETTATKQGSDWVINGMKRFNTGMHTATVDLVFARTSGKAGDARGISAFLTPVTSPGFKVEHMWWTFNMPSDHAEVSLTDVKVPASTMLGEEGRGLDVAQTFVHENRIRQAASSLGAAQYCIDMSVAYAKNRKVFGKALASNQAIQFPLAELHTEAEMTRGLVRKTAWHLDREHHMNVSEWVAMSNYRANRLVCDAADRAIQVHGGIGYSRHTPFEHIYRHHRRYRITEGSEEIQIRRVAGALFGFWGAQKASTAPKDRDALPPPSYGHAFGRVAAKRSGREGEGPSRGASNFRSETLKDHPCGFPPPYPPPYDGGGMKSSAFPLHRRRLDVRHGDAHGLELSVRQGRARRHEPAALQRLALPRGGLFLFAMMALMRKPLALPRRDWVPMIVLSLIGVALFQACWGLAMARTRAVAGLDRHDHHDRLLRHPGVARRPAAAGPGLGRHRHRLRGRRDRGQQLALALSRSRSAASTAR